MLMSLATISLADLKDQDPDIDVLRIRSIDPELYIVEVEFEDTSWRVLDDHGEPLTFRGVPAAKRPFAPFRIGEAFLVHQSAHDEMIGQPLSDEGNMMQVRIALPRRA